MFEKKLVAPNEIVGNYFRKAPLKTPTIFVFSQIIFFRKYDLAPSGRRQGTVKIVHLNGAVTH